MSGLFGDEFCSLRTYVQNPCRLCKLFAVLVFGDGPWAAGIRCSDISALSLRQPEDGTCCGHSELGHVSTEGLHGGWHFGGLSEEKSGIDRGRRNDILGSRIGFFLDFNITLRILRRWRRFRFRICKGGQEAPTGQTHYSICKLNIVSSRTE